MQRVVATGKKNREKKDQKKTPATESEPLRLNASALAITLPGVSGRAAV